MSTRSGIVLAGGFARRFGDRDKTLAELHGRALIEHAVEPLQSTVGHVVVSCRRGQIDDYRNLLTGVEYCPDPTPDEGPLAGLAAALKVIDATHVAVSMADRPCVPPGLYRFLFDSLLDDGVVIRANGIDQPAPAVFNTHALRMAVETQLAADTRRLRAVLEALEVDTVPIATVADRWGNHVLVDVNTEADLEKLESVDCR